MMAPLSGQVVMVHLQGDVEADGPQFRRGKLQVNARRFTGPVPEDITNRLQRQSSIEQADGSGMTKCMGTMLSFQLDSGLPQSLLDHVVEARTSAQGVKWRSGPKKQGACTREWPASLQVPKN